MIKPHPHHHARRTPDKPAYIMARSGEVVTYRELEERSNQGAQFFRQNGLQNGDAVVMMIENSARLPEICFGAARAGLFYTAMSTHLSPGEAEYIIRDCGAKIMIASYALRDIAKAAFARVKSCKALYFIDGPKEEQAWEKAVSSMPITPIPDQAAGVDMLYSSGTTGRPKGVKISSPATSYDDPPRIVGFLENIYGMDEHAIYISPAPLYHAAPLRFTLGVMRIGATAIIMEKFDAREALGTIERYKVTHGQWVPSMFVRMLKLPVELRDQYNLSSLKQAIHAAAPCPVQIKEAMIKWWGPVLWEFYAGSEGNGFVSCNCEEWLENPGTVGRAILGEIRILDAEQNPLPPGKSNIGDVYFADAPLFEYHNDPGKTASSRSKQGWTTLGDIGYLNDRGYLFLTDRKAHMIISGGVNIYPQEVENLLISHSQVADAAVIGVPSEYFGEEVKAIIQPLDWADANDDFAARLMAFCKANISAIKCPRSIDFAKSLPRQPNGKLFKRVLRDQYWQDHETNLV